ncbi:MAG: DUF1667 domain-containing protein [Caloramator sp.]|nr:DUF1667 domain-containing protein [Caloramator sp.]
MEERNLTCINCPMGCSLKVKIYDDKIEVEGNICSRGREYAENEVTNPKRTVTSTMKVIGGERSVVSVKTSGEIPKKNIFDLMKIINDKSVNAPVKIGDVLIEDVFGVNVVATSNVDKL